MLSWYSVQWSQAMLGPDSWWRGIKLGLCLCWLVQLCLQEVDTSSPGMTSLRKLGRSGHGLVQKKYNKGEKGCDRADYGQTAPSRGFELNTSICEEGKEDQVPSQRILEQAQPAVSERAGVGCPCLVSKNRSQCRHRWQILKWGWPCRCCPLLCHTACLARWPSWELPHDH